MKRAVIPTVNKSGPELAELENQIRIQNQEYYDIYEKLADNVSDDDQIDILNANLQIVPETKSQVSVCCRPCANLLFIIILVLHVNPTTKFSFHQFELTDSSPFDRHDLLWCFGTV